MTRRRAISGWVFGAALSVGACVEQGDVLSVTPTESTETLGGTPAPPVSLVSASDRHTCALSTDVIYCWGNNEFGQLGAGSEETQLGPTPLEQRGWRSVVTGLTHTCALTLEGQVYCWGNNEAGQLGQGNRDSSLLPLPVALAAPAAELSSGFNHSCALLETGELWCWGDNNEGQLGQDDIFPGAESRAGDALLPVVIVSPVVADGGAVNWRAVDAGEGHTCALESDQSLWCWGRNGQGQLGTPTEESQGRLPLLVSTDHDWVQVDAGQNYTCALDRDGSLWCWGYNMGIMSGSGNPFGSPSQELRVPTRVSDGPWVALSTNMFHTCALDATAELWCWGRRSDGQLATPDETVQLTPVDLASNVAQVSAGTFTTCFVGFDGALRCAGKNVDGQLGAGTGSNEAAFLPVILPNPGSASP